MFDLNRFMDASWYSVGLQHTKHHVLSKRNDVAIIHRFAHRFRFFISDCKYYSVSLADLVDNCKRLHVVFSIVDPVDHQHSELKSFRDEYLECHNVSLAYIVDEYKWLLVVVSVAIFVYVWHSDQISFSDEYNEFRAVVVSE